MVSSSVKLKVAMVILAYSGFSPRFAGSAPHMSTADKLLSMIVNLKVIAVKVSSGQLHNDKKLPRGVFSDEETDRVFSILFSYDAV